MPEMTSIRADTLLKKSLLLALPPLPLLLLQVHASNKSYAFMMAVGHYGLSNWSPECYLNYPDDLNHYCYESSIHTCPGVYGYYPLIHRNHRYWMQIIYDGPGMMTGSSSSSRLDHSSSTLW